MANRFERNPDKDELLLIRVPGERLKPNERELLPGKQSCSYLSLMISFLL